VILTKKAAIYWVKKVHYKQGKWAKLENWILQIHKVSEVLLHKLSGGRCSSTHFSEKQAIS
jgi:hypothetical protein